MHIHGKEQALAECPSLAAAGDDGLIDTLDGLPAYGGILVSLTTEGGTGAALDGDALALDRFPVATRGAPCTTTVRSRCQAWPTAWTNCTSSFTART